MILGHGTFFFMLWHNKGILEMDPILVWHPLDFIILTSMTYAKAYFKFGKEIGNFLHLLRPGTMKKIKQKGKVLKAVSKISSSHGTFLSHCLSYGDEKTVSCIEMAGCLCQDGPHSCYVGRWRIYPDSYSWQILSPILGGHLRLDSSLSSLAVLCAEFSDQQEFWAGAFSLFSFFPHQKGLQRADHSAQHSLLFCQEKVRTAMRFVWVEACMHGKMQELVGGEPCKRKSRWVE